MVRPGVGFAAARRQQLLVEHVVGRLESSCKTLCAHQVIRITELGRPGTLWARYLSPPCAGAASWPSCGCTQFDTYAIRPCCVRNSSAFPQAWNVLGLCFTSQGDIRDGVRAYERATELNPKLKEAWVNMGQVGAAARVLWRSSTAYGIRAMGAPQQTRPGRLWGRRYHTANRSRGLNPRTPCPSPAQALKEEGRTKEAERALTRALALDPPDQPSVHVLRVLAQMRQQLGEHAAAVRLLERAVPLAQQKEEQVGRAEAAGSA